MASGVTPSTHPTRSKLVSPDKRPSAPTPLLLSLQQASVRSSSCLNLHQYWLCQQQHTLLWQLMKKPQTQQQALILHQQACCGVAQSGMPKEAKPQAEYTPGKMRNTSVSDAVTKGEVQTLQLGETCHSCYALIT
jgi:hypothetical protein